MTASIPIPSDVVRFLRDVFYQCNLKITGKLSRNPNIAEEFLDMTWIEHLGGYSSTVSLPSSWLVRVDVHYLGGMKHFYSWEIADIGILLFIRRAGRVERSKVALLQSKRLYPKTGTVEEEGKIDYEIGFARLADPEALARSIGVEAEFNFDVSCKYGALIAKSDQVRAITDYQKKDGIAVYYQLYNPWLLPFSQRIPRFAGTEAQEEMRIGVRIVLSEFVHAVLSHHAKEYRPQFKDLYSNPADELGVGWPLEHFVSELLLGYQEGTIFGSIGEGRIQNLFFRRSGPIAAAIAIHIEAP